MRQERDVLAQVPAELAGVQVVVQPADLFGAAVRNQEEVAPARRLIGVRNRVRDRHLERRVAGDDPAHVRDEGVGRCVERKHHGDVGADFPVPWVMGPPEGLDPGGVGGGERGVHDDGVTHRSDRIRRAVCPIGHTVATRSTAT